MYVEIRQWVLDQYPSELGKFLGIGYRRSKMIGELCILATAMIFVTSTKMLMWWYTAWLFPLLLHRLITYSQVGYGYFMIDFCYFVNMLLMLGLHILPHNRKLFLWTFSLATGPVAWAIVAWRNSMVSYDLDKMTSVFIHIMPILVVVRKFHWNDADVKSCNADLMLRPPTVLELVVEPLGLYALWQITYLIKTEATRMRLTEPKSVAKDETQVTSAKLMSSKAPLPVLVAVFKRAPKKFHTFVFVGLQLVFTLLTVGFGPIWAKSFHLTMVFVTFLVAVLIVNGAGFELAMANKKERKLREELGGAAASESKETEARKKQSILAEDDDMQHMIDHSDSSTNLATIFEQVGPMMQSLCIPVSEEAVNGYLDDAVDSEAELSRMVMAGGKQGRPVASSNPLFENPSGVARE